MTNAQNHGRLSPDPMLPRMGPDENTYRAMLRDELVLTRADLFGLVRRRIWTIVLVMIVFVGLVVGFSLLRAPTYEASTLLLVGLEEQRGAAPDLNNEVVGLQQLTETMLTAVTTRPIAQDVIQRLNLSISSKSFLENLSAQRVGTTQYIEVSYKDSSPEKAQRVANTLGDVFSENAPDINPTSRDIIVKVWEPAVVADSPTSPALLRNALAGLVLGLMLGLGLAFVLEYLDNSWNSLDEVEQVSGVPALGAIPASKR